MRSGSEFQTEVPEYGILNRGMGVDFGVEVGIGVHLIFFLRLKTAIFKHVC